MYRTAKKLIDQMEERQPALLSQLLSALDSE
jgi:hypothetical protein